MSPFRLTDIKKLRVYEYQHLDDLSFIKRPQDVLSNFTTEELEQLLGSVRERFREAGWEGDGNLGLMWLPPFADVGVQDTEGTYVWHVKQRNNGTSWLGSPTALNFARLREQNEHPPYATHIPVGLLFGNCNQLGKAAKRHVADLRRKLDAIDRAKVEFAPEIKTDLLVSAHGDLIATTQDFLDECYLTLLQHVFKEGNSARLELEKFRVRL